MPESVVPAEQVVSKRYKSYPISHFSKWRYHFQLIILDFLILPFVILRYRPIIFGRKHVPEKGPFIVAANHISMVDPPLVSLAVHYPVAYMAKKELFKHPLAAEFYRSQGCFALDRDNPDSATLKTAFNVLKSPANWALGIFPEGTRSMDGRILPLKKGLGGLAQKTKSPVLPVGITRNEEGRFVVTVGELITDVADADALQDRVYEALVHLVDLSWDRSALQ